MKKSLLLAGLLLIGSTNAMAAKVGDMSVGFEFGASNTDGTTKTTDLSTSTSDKGSTNTSYEAVKISSYLDYGRTSFVLGHINEKDDVTVNYIGAAYDYMVYNESKFTPFIGGLVSYSDGKVDSSPFDFSETGFNYGAEAGVLFEISQSFDIEIGARYLFSNASGDDTVGNTHVNVAVDNITQYYFGLNYNF